MDSVNGFSIQMGGFGERLRSERERLRLTQADFGALGGVKANAQIKYEKGDRYPDAEYLAAIAKAGVDVLFIITGETRPVGDGLNARERVLFENFRALSEDEQAAIQKISGALAQTTQGKKVGNQGS